MPTPTYTLIDSVTLASSASSVTFSGISATGKGDLVLAVDQISSATEDLLISINSNTTGADYPSVRMRGSGSAASTNTDTNRQIGHATTGRSNNIIQIMDYSATDKHKSILSRNGDNQVGVYAYAMRFASTAAVTSISLAPNAGTFNASSTFHLYQLVSE